MEKFVKAKRVFKKLPAFQLVLMLVLVSGVMLGLSCEKAFAVALDNDAFGVNAEEYTTWGDGWDGPGQGSANLSYYFGAMSGDLDPTAQQNTFRAALDVWASVAALSFSEMLVPNQTSTLDIFFTLGDHGDGFPFGPNTLAHAFFPPPNPEPIAGDAHFNDAFTWEIGDSPGGSDGKYDLMWVAVHEFGHSLGLGHSDVSGAVMFPTVGMNTVFTDLHADDIAGIQSIYAPVPEPLSILLFGSGLVGLFGFKRRTGHGEMG